MPNRRPRPPKACEGDGPKIVVVAAQSRPRFIDRLEVGEICRENHHVNQSNQQFCPKLSGSSAVDRERALQPLPSFTEAAALGPEPPQRSGQLLSVISFLRRGESPVE